MTVEIQHFKDTLNYTPAVEIISKAQYELIASGFSEPLISILWDDELVLALIDGEPVGFITWKYSAWMRMVNIHLGWVDPMHRRQGVYTKCWEALVEKAREAGAVNISGSTHMDNTVMRRAAQNLGREELSVNLMYRIPPK